MDVETTRMPFERNAMADIWRNTLSMIPSVFGRMVYLASMRDTNSGRYEHHGLAQRYGSAAASQALAESHHRCFEDWIGFSLEMQRADLDLYISDLPDTKKTIIESWLLHRPYRSLMPAPVGTPEAAIFLSDFETLLELFRTEYGAFVPDPDA